MCAFQCNYNLLENAQKDLYKKETSQGTGQGEEETRTAEQWYVLKLGLLYTTLLCLTFPL